MSGLPQAPAQDDLVVSLPPEILAMMASYETPAADEAAVDETTLDEASNGESPAATLSADQPSSFGSEAGDLDASADADADAGPTGDEAGAPLPASIVSGEAGETLTLAPVLDITAAAALHAELLARRGAPLGLDAAEVRRLGGQCLQLLVSARKTWEADGLALTLTATSPAFERDLALLGCSAADLTQSEAA
ncbi:STAS domain-containing protein [Aureimonas pseudogalii]|uniref:Anti-anti-sigma regulatory factor n=1 Tax=Aureimonas pseudogalii TaxID=1744844 RepID=A0A7W6H6W8_9HYPH|nr:STAS domain-containing protein [Aureimonas pseudogalii]MBB3999632.1 anti-anti-sigma regulatory factor [Aureimonas pseudogalii]